MGKILPTAVPDRRRGVPPLHDLSEAERERVARDVAVALAMPSSHGRGSPWVDPYEGRVFWQEEVLRRRRELDFAEHQLALTTAADVDRYSRDDVDQDREDARDREVRQDEAAAKNAPGVAS